jgi:hypothetical protein
MKQPEVSHEYLRSVMLKERKARLRRKQIFLALGLLLIASLLLALLIARHRPATLEEEPPSAYYPLNLENASPTEVRHLLHEGKKVVIHSPEKPGQPDTLNDMASYFAFFRDRYFEGQ